MIKGNRGLLVKDHYLESLFFNQHYLDCKIFLHYKKVKILNLFRLTYLINQIILLSLLKFRQNKFKQLKSNKKKDHFFHRFLTHLIQGQYSYKVNKLEKNKK